MPPTLIAFLSLADFKNRCRQRNAVSSAILDRLAALRRLTPSASACAYLSHASRRCRRANGVPVSALNVLPHAEHQRVRLRSGCDLLRPAVSATWRGRKIGLDERDRILDRGLAFDCLHKR